MMLVPIFLVLALVPVMGKRKVEFPVELVVIVVDYEGNEWRNVTEEIVRKIPDNFAVRYDQVCVTLIKLMKWNDKPSYLYEIRPNVSEKELTDFELIQEPRAMAVLPNNKLLYMVSTEFTKARQQRQDAQKILIAVGDLNDAFYPPNDKDASIAKTFHDYGVSFYVVADAKRIWLRAVGDNNEKRTYTLYLNDFRPSYLFFFIENCNFIPLCSYSTHQACGHRWWRPYKYHCVNKEDKYVIHECPKGSCDRDCDAYWPWANASCEHDCNKTIEISRTPNATDEIKNVFKHCPRKYSFFCNCTEETTTSTSTSSSQSTSSWGNTTLEPNSTNSSESTPSTLGTTLEPSSNSTSPSTPDFTTVGPPSNGTTEKVDATEKLGSGLPPYAIALIVAASVIGVVAILAVAYAVYTKHHVAASKREMLVAKMSDFAQRADQ